MFKNLRKALYEVRYVRMPKDDFCSILITRYSDRIKAGRWNLTTAAEAARDNPFSITLTSEECAQLHEVWSSPEWKGPRPDPRYPVATISFGRPLSTEENAAFAKVKPN